MRNDELMHYGVPGMKWGVRKQTSSGSGGLSKSGQKKAQKLKDQYTKLTGKHLKSNPRKNTTVSKPKQKSISEMSDAEIRTKINRIKLEKELKSLSPKQVSRGRAFMDKVAHDVVAPAATDVAKQLTKSMLTKAVNNRFNLDDELKVYTNNKKK